MSDKDKKSAGAERKDRLAAELRANLKRRKAKTGEARAPQGKASDKAERR